MWPVQTAGDGQAVDLLKCANGVAKIVAVQAVDLARRDMRPVEQDFGLRDQHRVSLVRLLRRRLVDRPAKGGRIGGRERGAGRRGQAPKHGDGEGSYHALTTQDDLRRSRVERLRAHFNPRRRLNRWLIKGRQIMSAFEEFLKENPKMADEPYGASMARTLSKAFPCGAQ